MAEALLLGAGLGAATGLAKYAGDVQGNANDRTLNAAIARYSPWTGMKPGTTRKANLAGDVLPAAAMGAAVGQLAPGLFSGLTGAGASTLAAPTALGGGLDASLAGEGAGAAGMGAGMGGASISPWAAMA